MLRRVLKQHETKEYRVILQRSQGGNYAIANTDVEEKDRDIVSSYLDTLMLDRELIPDDTDKVLVNLKETGKSLTCEVKTLSWNPGTLFQSRVNNTIIANDAMKEIFTLGSFIIFVSLVWIQIIF